MPLFSSNQYLKECLSHESPSLSVENFISALTADVASYTAKASHPTQERLTMTSIFHDVFGFNWDDHFKKRIDEGPGKLVGTAAFIDYAADTYRCVIHYTAVWSLFILTGELC